ncbi:MAG: hypothetical protein VB021_10075 [Oscillospiraceae bacterium]|nr:hypothetical protein [Oscillospiraceae bacterium]
MTERKGTLSVGAVSIFLIFTVLLLVTFSLLALAVARTDEKQSERASQTTAAYYAADTAAWEKLDAAVKALESDPGGAGAALEAEGIGLERAGDAAVLSFETPVSDVLTLYSRVRLTFGGNAVVGVAIESWRCAPAQN